MKTEDIKNQIEVIEVAINELYNEYNGDIFKRPAYIKLRDEQRELEKLFDFWSARNIQKYCNKIGYSDVDPYEVVKVISDKTVEIRAMKATQVDRPQEFIVGGFSAHCADNHNQSYTFESNEDAHIIRVRWSEANKRWQQSNVRFSMDSNPRKFYDYNF